MNKKLITIFHNGEEISETTCRDLTARLLERGYEVTDAFSEDTDLIVCIGGDGAFLRTMHRCGFPETPIVGVNTGHLGFFQEVWPEEFDNFIVDYELGSYTIQKLGTVMGIATTTDGKKDVHIGLNELAVTGSKSYSIHLDLSIGG